MIFPMIGGTVAVGRRQVAGACNRSGEPEHAMVSPHRIETTDRVISDRWLARLGLDVGITGPLR